MKRLYILFISALFIAGCAGSSGVNNSGQFTEKQRSLIMAGETGSIMKVITINNKQDSLLLRSKSENVIPDTNDVVLNNLIDRLYATVNDTSNPGVGIAAPQVGILKNIIWVQRYDKAGEPFEVYLNPKILQYSKQKLPWVEGCLSIPGMKDTTRTRSYTILLDYDRPDNTHNTEMVEGFTAIIFQHEIDHLSGVLYIDRLR